MAIKILTTILISSICLFVLTLVLSVKEIFFKKYLKAESYKKQEFWRTLDDINGIILVFSLVFTLAIVISLLITIIWS